MQFPVNYVTKARTLVFKVRGPERKWEEGEGGEAGVETEEAGGGGAKRAKDRYMEPVEPEGEWWKEGIG